MQQSRASSRFHVVLDIIERENPTIRQLLHRLAGARGHWVQPGTPEQIADKIEEWFDNGAADGFNIMSPYLQGGFDIFAEEVVPILRKRGLFRHDYDGATLRDHFGLPRPPSSAREQVQVISSRSKSRSITTATAPAIAATGVDLISIGWLTHSAPILDIGLDFRASL